jgi:hypothetical protein
MSDAAFATARTFLERMTPETFSAADESALHDLMIEHSIDMNRAISGVLTEDEGLLMACAAHDDDTSWELATAIIFKRLEKGLALPYFLSQLAALMVLGGKKKKRGRKTNASRDAFIVAMIEFLQEKHSIQPTRNATSSSPAGTAIMAVCLSERGFNITESAVEKIWASRQK